MSDSNEAEKPTEVGPDTPAPDEERGGRRMFVATELWTALCGHQSQRMAWNALAAAVASAHNLISERTCCVACRREWADDVAPAAAILTEVIESDDPAEFVPLVCANCWTGGFDSRLKEAVAREFGKRASDLQPIHHSAGRA